QQIRQQLPYEYPNEFVMQLALRMNHYHQLEFLFATQQNLHIWNDMQNLNLGEPIAIILHHLHYDLKPLMMPPQEQQTQKLKNQNLQLWERELLNEPLQITSPSQRLF